MKNAEFCDIVVPVYNALSQTRRCVASVLEHGSHPFRLILVNDGSDSATTEYLRNIAQSDERIVLLENDDNLGFVKTVNRGLGYQLDESSAAQPGWKIILNSDTIVTSGWLEAFDACFNADPSIGIATPLSNNAENLSIPIPEGENAIAFAEYVRSTVRQPSYPDITTAVGFCMGFRTELLREIGLFDELFGAGYAEDSDHHFKAVYEGWRSVLIDNCFIHHESHASFSSDKTDHVRSNRPLFDHRWLTTYLSELEYHDAVDPIGKLARQLRAGPLAETGPATHDVLFVLPTSELCGGIIVVYEIIEQLLAQGIRANAVVLTEPRPIEMNLTFAPFFLPRGAWHDGTIPEAKTFVATHYETVPYAFFAGQQYPAAQLTYLVQGFEGWFPDATLSSVTTGYRAITNRIVVSTWLQKMLARWKCDATVIGNGVDPDFFAPRADWLSTRRQKRLFIMLRDDPQGSLTFATSLLERLAAEASVDVVAVGSASQWPRFKRLVAEAHGIVDRRQMAKLLASCDICVDCSMVQGFGMIGLEGMSSGVAAVLTKTGGVREYATDDNAVLVPLGDVDALFASVTRLLDDEQLLLTLKQAGRQTAIERSWQHVGEQYAAYFNQLLGAPQPARDVASADALASYLFETLDRREERLALTQKNLALLIQELGSLTPSRTLTEVLREKLPKETLDDWLRAPEGQFINQLYEAASKNEQRSDERLRVYRENVITADVPRRALPLLDKVIDATQAVAPTKQRQRADR